MVHASLIRALQLQIGQTFARPPFLEFLPFGAQVSSSVTSLAGQEERRSIVGTDLQGQPLHDM